MPDAAVPACEIAFVSPPADEDPDWEDVSADLRSFSFSRGKQRELDRFQAGRGSVVLKNKTRQYDPNNAAGDHYGDIKPQRRIRLTAEYDGDTYPLIEGYIDSWDQQRHGPRTGDTVVQFTDGFKILNRAGLASSAYVQEVLADGPVHFWRLGDPADTTSVIDSVGDLHFTGFSESPTFGSTGVVSREPGTAMLIDGDDEGVYLLNAPPVVSGNPVTVEVVLAVNAATGGALVFTNTNRGTTGFDDEIVVRFYGTNGDIEFAVFVGGTGALIDSTNTTLADGSTVHIACVWETGGALKIYRNGVDVTNGSASVTPADFAPATFDVLALGNLPPDATDAYWGAYQMVAVYDQALTAARIAAHAEAVATPWNNDTPEDRIGRVLDAVGWPAALRDLDAGNTTLQSATLGTSALEHLQKVAESEFGKLFISKDNKVRFISREAAWNQTTAGTLADDTDYQSSDPEYGDDLIRNEVTISRSEGVAQTVRDDASIGEYLINSYTLDGLYHDDDTHSRNAAQYILDVYKDPHQRISGLTIKPAADPDALFPLLLGLELGDWIAIEETPQNTGSAVTTTGVIEGITVDWSPEDWTFDLALSPADTRPYWLAGVVGYSEAGVSTRAGF